MAKNAHTMIRVFDLKRSINFYAEALGLESVGRYEFDNFTLVYLRNAETDFEIELTYNHDQREPYGHGSGYGHMAVTVEDLEAEQKRLRNAEIATHDIVEMKHEGQLMAKFFFVEDPDGYKIEFIQRGGRYL